MAVLMEGLATDPGGARGANQTAGIPHDML